MNEKKGTDLLVTNLELYKSHSSTYDLIYFDDDRYTEEVNFIDKICTEIGPGRRILDVACGTGLHAKMLSERGYSITGVDISSDMILQAQKKCPELNFVHSDMRFFELDQNFDAIICMYGAINYLQKEEDFRITFENFFQHIKPSGVVMIDTRWSNTLPEHPYIKRRGDFTIIRRWAAGQGIDKSDVYVHTIFDAKSEEFSLDVHNLFLQDPFLLADLMEAAGFQDVRIFARYDISKPFVRDGKEHEAIIVARKPR